MGVGRWCGVLMKRTVNTAVRDVWRHGMELHLQHVRPTDHSAVGTNRPWMWPRKGNPVNVILWSWPCEGDLVKVTPCRWPCEVTLWMWSRKVDPVKVALWMWSCEVDPVKLTSWRGPCEGDPVDVTLWRGPVTLILWLRGHSQHKRGEKSTQEGNYSLLRKVREVTSKNCLSRVVSL